MSDIFISFKDGSHLALEDVTEYMHSTFTNCLVVKMAIPEIKIKSINVMPYSVNDEEDLDNE